MNWTTIYNIQTHKNRNMAIEFVFFLRKYWCMCICLHGWLEWVTSLFGQNWYVALFVYIKLKLLCFYIYVCKGVGFQWPLSPQTECMPWPSCGHLTDTGVEEDSVGAWLGQVSVSDIVRECIRQCVCVLWLQVWSMLISTLSLNINIQNYI